MAYAAFRRYRGAWFPVAIGLGIVICLSASLGTHDAAIASEPVSTLSDTDALRSPGRPPVKEHGLRSPWSTTPQPYSAPAIARRPIVEHREPTAPAQQTSQPFQVQRNLPATPGPSADRIEPVHDSLMPDQTDTAFRPRLSASTVQRLPQNESAAEPPLDSTPSVQSPVGETPAVQQPEPDSQQPPAAQDEQVQASVGEERPMESMFLHEHRPIPAPLIREVRPWGSQPTAQQHEAQPQPHQEQPQLEQLSQEQPNEDAPRQEPPQEAAQPQIGRPEPAPSETSRSESASEEEPDWFKNLPSSESAGHEMPVPEPAGVETQARTSDPNPQVEAPVPPEIEAVRQTMERVERLPYVLRLTVEKSPPVSLRTLQGEPQSNSIPLRTPLMPGPGEFDDGALPSNYELPPTDSAPATPTVSESPPEPPGEAVFVSDRKTPADEEPGQPLPDTCKETEPKPLASLAKQGEGSKPRRFALIDSAEPEASRQPSWGVLRAFDMFSKTPRNP